MNRAILFCTIFFIAYLQIVLGQNLVLNGSFEDMIYYHQDPTDSMSKFCVANHPTTSCTNLLYNYYTHNPKVRICYQMPYWISPVTSIKESVAGLSIAINTDLCLIERYSKINSYSFSTYSKAHSGKYVLEIFVFGNTLSPLGNNSIDTNKVSRTYTQTKLRYPLRRGCRYKASCYVKIRNTYFTQLNMASNFYPEYTGSDGFGMYFSTDSIKASDNKSFFKYTPQVSNPKGNIISDTANYTFISGEFVAQGGEQYLTLGNFKTNQATQTLRTSGIDIPSIITFALDDISVEPIDDVPNQPLSLESREVNFCKPLELKSKGDFDKYLWSNGDTNQNASINAPGNYWVQATKGKCYVDWDSVEVKDTRKPPIATQSKVSVHFCEEPIKPFTFAMPNVFSSYLWSNGSTSNQILIKEKGLYIVDATYPCGVVRDTVEAKVLPIPSPILNVSGDTNICNLSVLEIATLQAWNRYAWHNGNDKQSISVTESGKIKVEVQNYLGCIYKDSANVSFYHDLPQGFIPQDTLFCAEQALVIDNPMPSNCSVLVNKFSTPFLIDTSGIYVIKTLNPCFARTDTLKVHLISCTNIEIPNLVSANKDDKNDYWEIKTDLPRSFSIEIYNRWGIRQFASQSYQNNWPTDSTTPDIYFYHLNDHLNKKSYKGWVHVLQ